MGTMDIIRDWRRLDDNRGMARHLVVFADSRIKRIDVRHTVINLVSDVG